MARWCGRQNDFGAYNLGKIEEAEKSSASSFVALAMYLVAEKVPESIMLTIPLFPFQETDRGARVHPCAKRKLGEG
jgi:hypothetical protein